MKNSFQGKQGTVLDYSKTNEWKIDTIHFNNIINRLINKLQSKVSSDFRTGAVVTILASY